MKSGMPGVDWMAVFSGVDDVELASGRADHRKGGTGHAGNAAADAEGDPVGTPYGQRHL